MKRSLLFFLTVIGVGMGSQAIAQNIYTYAGIAGLVGYTGDDSLATLAQLAGPSGVAVHGGNTYFADNFNNVIRKVDASGIITTIAGTGAAGYGGDGAVATAARLAGPTGVAVDHLGNILISDTRNNVIRRIDPAGIISTVAGTRGPGAYGGDGGPATDAQLWTPVGVAFDGAGGFYIADARNLVVRWVDASGVISTFAGNNTYGYTGDGGPASDAQLSVPVGVSVSPLDAKVYISDSRNNVIRIVNTSGTIGTFAGTGVPGHTGDGGPASAAHLFSPQDVKCDTFGNIFISDSSNTVRVINSGDTIRDFAGTGTAGYSGDGGPATAARMTVPGGLAVDALHNVYIATADNVIRRVGTPVEGIHITSNIGDTTCLPRVASFTAAPVADATPHYQWQLNGVDVGTDAATYTPTSLANGDIIGCILVSTGGAWLAMSNNLHIDSLPIPGTITGPGTFCIGSTANLRDAGGPFGGRWATSDPAVATVSPFGDLTPVGSGSATIYYIVTNECGTDTATHAVTVHPNAMADIIGPSDVCVGATASYTDASIPGQWRVRSLAPPGPPPPTPGSIDSATGSFTASYNPGPAIIFYGTNGCYRADTIMIDPLPINAPISGPVVVDSSWSITLTDPNPGGVWTSSNPAIATIDPASGVVVGVTSGAVTITYTITTPAGCSADTTYIVLVQAGTGTKPLSANSEVAVYPNPANGMLNISYPGNDKAAITVSDVTGRTVITTTVNSKSSLDISSLKTGVYLFSLKSGEVSYTTKLVVE